VVEGAVASEGRTIDEGAMGIARAGSGARVRATEPSRVMLLGGAPIDGTRHIWWNFVSSSEARIERAKRDWKEATFGAGAPKDKPGGQPRFGKVPGDEVEFIPLPE
jgi:redox-sensitive bicupin YhaK (pirin superfamily)